MKKPELLAPAGDYTCFQDVYKRQVQAGVNSAAVDTGYACHIFRFFHTAFDFKGINACFYQLRDKFYRAHILQAQRIAFLSVLSGQDPVGLPAGLGAPVSYTHLTHSSRYT